MSVPSAQCAAGVSREGEVRGIRSRVKGAVWDSLGRAKARAVGLSEPELNAEFWGDRGQETRAAECGSQLRRTVERRLR